jgi:hypothetical protein
MIFNDRFKYSLILYVGIIFILVILKPKFLFKNNGEFRAFGTGKDKTIFPFWLIIFVSVIISYYIANILVLLQY